MSKLSEDTLCVEIVRHGKHAIGSHPDAKITRSVWFSVSYGNLSLHLPLSPSLSGLRCPSPVCSPPLELSCSSPPITLSHPLHPIHSTWFARLSCTPTGKRHKQKQDKQILDPSLDSASVPGGWKDSPGPWDSGGGSALSSPACYDSPFLMWQAAESCAPNLQAFRQTATSGVRSNQMR